MRHEFFMTVLFFAAVLAPATPVRAGELGLRETVSLALEHSTRYRIAAEKSRESRLRVREAWGALWPSLSTDVSYTRQGADAGFNASIDGVYNVKFITGQLTVNPGVFYNTLQASRSSHVAAEHEVRRERAETTKQAIQGYYGLILARQTVAMRAASLKALDENLKTVTIGYNKGIFSRLDYLRAQVSYSNEKTQLINAENDYRKALASLNILIGNEIDEAIEIDETRMKVKDAEIAMVPDDKKEKKTLREMIGLALKNRPEMIQVKKKHAAERYGAAAARSMFLFPSLFVSGSYGTTKNVAGEGGTTFTPTGDPATDAVLMALQEGMKSSIAPSGWNSSWNITFGATYRWGALSPLDVYHARAGQGESRARQAELELEQLVKGVKLEIQQAFLKLKSAAVSLKSQEGTVETANESLRVAVTQFRSGIIDNTKLIEANVELLKARMLYLQALYDFQEARAELNRAIGVEYFTIE